MLPEPVVKLLLALLVGGVIGAEREFRDKNAGFRTIALISVSAALFTIYSVDFQEVADPTRIAANVVTGIGFLGAGTILRHEGGRVSGLTTAATIWLAAALGMGIGVGEYVLVGIATGAVLVVLWIFPVFERWLDGMRETVTYRVVFEGVKSRRTVLMEMLRKCGVRALWVREGKEKDRVVVEMLTMGRPRGHQSLRGMLMDHPEVTEFWG